MANQQTGGRGGAAFQEFKLKGSQLLEKVREVIDEGNARRITIKNGDRTLLEFPLAVGVGGAAAAVLLAPALAAIGALAALLSDVEVIVERDTDGDGTADESKTILGGKKSGSGSGSGSPSGSSSTSGGSSNSGSGSGSGTGSTSGGASKTMGGTAGGSTAGSAGTT